MKQLRDEDIILTATEMDNEEEKKDVDLLILKHALKLDAVILTNDRYRKYIGYRNGRKYFIIFFYLFNFLPNFKISYIQY